MKTSEFLKLVEEDFFKRLEQKTGWGKEEVKVLYRLAVQDILMKALEDS